MRVSAVHSQNNKLVLSCSVGNQFEPPSPQSRKYHQSLQAIRHELFLSTC